MTGNGQSRDQDNEQMRVTLHRFFERLIVYLDRPDNTTSWGPSDFDNFKFLVHELFLYAVAYFIQEEHFLSAAYLIETEYYVRRNEDYGRNAMVPFAIFRGYVESIEYRNQRLSLRRASLHADMLKERCVGSGVEFRSLMQADFVLFMNACLRDIDNWWPTTLVYASHFNDGAFEVFSRAQSLRYFDRVKILLGVKTKEDILPVLERLRMDGQRSMPRWDYRSFSPSKLLNFDQIATKP